LSHGPPGRQSAGTPDTNNKNIVGYLKEDLGFEVDPHAHQTLYNYADVAYLIDALGMAPSHTAGGMIVGSPESSILDQFWAPITGEQYPAYTWEAAILWGGGTANHVNEESLWASDVWKPRGKYHFLEHDDAAPVPNVGHYGSRWENLDRLLAMQQDGELEAGRIYTCSLFVSQGQLAQSPALIAEFEEAIEERNARGAIRWVGLAKLIDIWHAEYGSQPNVLPFQVGPSL